MRNLVSGLFYAMGEGSVRGVNAGDAGWTNAIRPARNCGQEERVALQLAGICFLNNRYESKLENGGLTWLLLRNQ
jgi:hypothetical protein